MTARTRETVEAYLKQYGWKFNVLESGQIESGWQGNERLFPLYITSYDNWLALQVCPLENLNIDWENWPEVARYLLEWVDACHMVKVAIGPTGELGIGLDLMLKGLDFSIFAEALTVLGHYVEKLYDDLLSFFDSIGYSYCQSLDILT